MTSTVDVEGEDDAVAPSVTPLPRLQLFVILLMQSAEQVSGSTMYPLINQFVRDTGVAHGNEAKIGHYAGIIGSSVFAMECLSVVFWGRTSDRVGRRPIVLLAVFGAALSMIGTGLSSYYIPLLLCQASMGVFHGGLGVAKSIMAEMTDSTNMPDALAFVPFTLATGAALGSLTGGALALPSKRWPDTFGKLEFFRTHPYFLPCAFAGLYSMLCFILGSTLLKETLPAVINRRKVNTEEARGWSRLLKLRRNSPNYGSIPAVDATGPTLIATSADDRPLLPPLSSAPIRTVLVRPVLLALLIQVFIGFIHQSWLVLVPLMYSTPIPLGGLGLEPRQIGTVMGVSNLAAGISQLLVFGWSMRRFGPRKVLCLSFACYILGISLFAIASYFAQSAGRVDAKVVCIMGLQTCTFLVGKMAWGCNLAFIIHSAPTPESLATVNGLAQLAHSMSRAIAPAAIGSLFSLSLERHLGGGLMVYWFLAGFIFFGGILAGLWMPDHLQRKGSRGKRDGDSCSS